MDEFLPQLSLLYVDFYISKYLKLADKGGAIEEAEQHQLATFTFV